MSDVSYAGPLQSYLPQDDGSAPQVLGRQPTDLLQRYMTHQQEQPNPAAPIVQRIRERFQPPDLTPTHLPGTVPADYLRELYRNPDIRDRRRSGSRRHAG